MVTPFSLVVADALGFVFDFALDFDATAVAVLVSITDDLVVLGEMGAGLPALPAFTGTAGFADGFFASALRTTALLAGARGLAALTGVAGFFVLLAATGFFGASAFLLATLAFDFTAAAGFDFTAALGATLATGFGAAFGFAATLVAGLARATTLVDLAVDLDFCVDFAISVLTL